MAEAVSERRRYDLGPERGQSLVDVLDRILEKGLVIAGDIRVNLADVELLTIQIRLLVCSVDKATEIGLDWWRSDPRLSTARERDGKRLTESLTLLEERLDSLHSRLDRLEGGEPKGEQPKKVERKSATKKKGAE
jgi:hypothetical protein